jgi:DNA-binding NarL/FixJ family response regulator
MADSKSTCKFEPDVLLHEASAIRALIVNADESSLERLSQTLSLYSWIMIVGEAKGVEDTLNKINELRPHVIIMIADNEIPAIDYDDIAAVCQAQLPGCVIIMAERPIWYVRLAIKAGATALLPKNVAHNELVDAIHKMYFWSQCRPLPQFSIRRGQRKDMPGPAQGGD